MSRERETRRLDARLSDDLEEAARLLRGGGLVAIPTETVYGLAALALDPLAVRGIYAAKGRPATNPLIVHVADVESARALTSAWPPLAQALADAFWPGPLTLVLPRAPGVPDEVTAGGNTVAIRIPGHLAALALLRRLGAPLAAPSANRSEHVSPTTAAHVLADLDGRIDAVLDGGSCDRGIESSVLQLCTEVPRLLRPGAIARDELEAIAGRIELGPDPKPLEPDTAVVLASPGQHVRHYAPAGLVRLCTGAELGLTVAALRSQLGDSPSRTIGVLLCGAGTSAPPDVLALRLPGEAEAYARRLYAALRELEDVDCGAIAIEAVPEGVAWDAVRDRLGRAAPDDA